MPARAAGSAAEGEEKAAEAGGRELLYCGTVRFDIMGRGVAHQGRGNLVSPTRLRPLVGVDIRFVASGCAACHCVALSADGRCFSWGRNENGQLGHGDTLLRNLPTVVSELSKYNIIAAGVGRKHTVVVTDEGKSFAFGDNKHGQLGTGSLKSGTVVSPVPCLVTEATNAVCGADFTVWLSSVEGSSILTAGLPQYGQLGHGSNNEYNAKASSVSLVYDPQPHPRAIAALSGNTVVKVACGTNHTVAVDSSGFVYTWGFGGYGRLGHNEQKDEWQPRLVEIFQKSNILGPNDVISAGSASSACTAGRRQLYMWGKVKNSGDEWMYPKPVMDLSGWNIRCMASGNMHHTVGADDSCISWGHSQYGELGYGPTQKSSVNPKKVDILEGMHVTSVGCGVGMSLIVVDRANVGGKLDQRPRKSSSFLRAANIPQSMKQKKRHRRQSRAPSAGKRWNMQNQKTRTRLEKCLRRQSVAVVAAGSLREGAEAGEPRRRLRSQCAEAEAGPRRGALPLLLRKQEARHEVERRAGSEGGLASDLPDKPRARQRFFGQTNGNESGC